MAQISSVTSESLQAKIRQLLPSQQGFGEDLQASNVILPVIDLTDAAEGTSTPVDLSRAFDFATSQSQIANTTTQIINTTGFWRINITVGIASPAAGSANEAKLTMSDGLSTKDLLVFTQAIGASDRDTYSQSEIIVFVKSGMSISGTTNSADTFLNVTYRQIADVNGNVTNPQGFTPQ